MIIVLFKRKRKKVLSNKNRTARNRSQYARQGRHTELHTLFGKKLQVAFLAVSFGTSVFIFVYAGLPSHGIPERLRKLGEGFTIGFGTGRNRFYHRLDM